MDELLRRYTHAVRNVTTALFIIRQSEDGPDVSLDESISYLDDDDCDSYHEYLNPKNLEEAKKNLERMKDFYGQVCRAVRYLESAFHDKS